MKWFRFLPVLMYAAFGLAAGASPISCEETPITESGATVYLPGEHTKLDRPILLGPGPHLFLDDYLITAEENLTRVVCQPTRKPETGNPVVTGKEDGCFQPYMTILRDPKTSRFRIWYGHHTDDLRGDRSLLGYMESADGIHWERPARILETPTEIQFGVSVVDSGPACADTARRFIYGYYHEGGLQLAALPDGLVWSGIAPGPVLRHNHDISGLSFDPLRKRFIATASVYRPGGWWTGNRRITMHAFSTNLLDWTDPHYVVLPDERTDSGETQFYAMDGYLARGNVIIGMVKVLRDDLKADDPPDPPDAYGVGYTTLAWSRDGVHWTRDAAPFFETDPAKGAWDHAHAWIDEQLPVGEEVYLYYGGYARGHKVNRFEERQIGLVTIKQDRYVARRAGAQPATLRTPPLLLTGNGVAVNANAAHGKLEVQVLDASGAPIPRFSFADMTPISVDGVNIPVFWKRPIEHLENRPVMLEFRLENAELFAFALSR